MFRRSAGIVVVATLSGLLVLPASAALAHEGRSQGDLEMTVGFGTEPAYAGQPNSVALILVHDGAPVVDLGNTLDVEVTFGDQTQRFPLEPNFAVGAFGEPGDYRACSQCRRPRSRAPTSRQAGLRPLPRASSTGESFGSSEVELGKGAAREA